ncbi:P-loop NTPase fold protein [Gemmatimonadota bacterium Y43]|uniref:KAP family P-loop NTPase fold protein n=1 Tax=Gaopeijia maritima TaxID=3119007 RepID=UPI003285AF66
MARFSLIDAPIDKFDEDCLGIGSYVEAMHEFVENCETPLTIGIQGDWGIGKTSFLKMLIDRLEGGRRAHTIYFNSWQYAQFGQDDALSLSIIRGIVRDIEALAAEGKGSYAEQARQKAKGFATFALNLAAQVVEAQTGANLRKAAEGEPKEVADDLVTLISRVKDTFADLVNTVTADGTGRGDAPNRLVIVIDDLDRLKPIRALEFLEAVKNFLDVPGCVFLLAVDFAVIERGMEAKLGTDSKSLQGKSYFDKIIQVPFNMPTGAFQTQRYVMELLGWREAGSGWAKRPGGGFYLHCGKEVPDPDEVRFLHQVTRLTVGTNPRSIKRSINYATLLKLIYTGGPNPQAIKLREAMLLYALASLQLAWPEVFAHLGENATGTTVSRLQDYEELEKISDFDRLLARVHNPEDVKLRIVAYFNELLFAVDQDGDGALSRDEFKVIPELLRGANLLSTDASDLDEAWRQFEVKIKEATSSNKVPARIADALALLRADGSHWHDRLRLRVVPAGKRLMNVLWGSRQIGSLVTTQKEPLQFYLKVDPDELREALKDKLGDHAPSVVHDVRGVGHWGTGDTKIDLVALHATGKKHVDILNEIHDAVLGERAEG